jgi:hypothetical protein
VVALGASNLTRGLPVVVAAARAACGPQVEMLAALGLGRSYGVRSRIFVRSLPSILDCRLWRELEDRPAVSTRALVTDVGNDILYGYSAEQTLAWVEEAVVRLQRHTTDIALTGLPLASIRRLSRSKFLLFRSVLVPSCRLTRAQVLERAERLEAGLEGLARRRGLRFVRTRSEWYGFDPVHIRPSLWRSAWHEILGLECARRRTWRSALEALRLYAQRPEREWILGLERVTPQPAATRQRSARLGLY